jgi:hypothetical protein
VEKKRQVADAEREVRSSDITRLGTRRERIEKEVMLKQSQSAFLQDEGEVHSQQERKSLIKCQSGRS